MNAIQKQFRRPSAVPLFAITTLCILIALPARAQEKMHDMRSLIEQALDEPSGFTITNKTLGEAIGLIAEQTGVPLRVRPSVMDLAPRGARTLIRQVEVANMPLREGLERVLDPLGMTFEVRDDHVEVLAKQGLSALGRRITWDELDTLAQLAHSEPGLDDRALSALKPIIQFRVPTRDPWSALSSAIQGEGAGPGDEVLSRACKKLGWTWTLDDKRIIVADGVETIRRKLAQRITLRITNRPLLDVLHAVGERVGVAIHTEPGLVASLPQHLQQNFSLDAHDDAVFVRLGHRPRLAQREPLRQSRGVGLEGRLIDLRGDHVERHAEVRQQLPPPRRGRREHQPVRAHRRLSGRASTRIRCAACAGTCRPAAPRRA